LSTTSFGKYRLVAELGQGGMADVILALSQGPVGFSKLVVIKRLRDHLAEDPEFVGMLIDEARLAARLNHPNIVHTHEVGEIGGRFFMAMEYLVGQPLTRLRRRAKRKKKPLSLEAELQILSDVLGALHYAHELTDFDGTPLGVVHRDVTPSNVFVTYDGVVKLVDFGIAKATGRSTETRTGVVKGKMTYMPPEQALGQHVDQRADVFSVGVMFWEAITGARMWKGVDDVVVLGKLINGDVPTSAKERNPDVSDELDAICQLALAPNPSDRYGTAREFQAAIDHYLDRAEKRVSNRELGADVATLFSNERDEIRRIIETQLSKLKEEPAGSLEPVMIPDSLPSSRTPSSTMSGLKSSHPSITDISLTEASPASAIEGSSAVVTVDRSEQGRRKRSMLGLGLALAAVVAGIVWVVGRPSDNAATSTTEAPPVPTVTATTTATTTTPAPTVAATSSAKPAVSRVRVTLRAVPASAQFSISNGSWVDNPHVGRFEVDRKMHKIRVRAKGYKQKNIVVPFDEDVVLDVTLEPVRRIGQPAVKTAKPAATDTYGDLPSPTKPKPRPLLEENPWRD
jgi:eukaryotic-like serine/threonine-protein kinase